MIYDLMSNGPQYSGIAPELWRKAFAFLETLNAETPVGRYEVEGEELFVLVQEYETKPKERYRVETHDKYLDIQLLLSGSETIYFSELAGLPVLEPYNPGKDIAFFGYVASAATGVPLKPGVFAAFLPGEGHLPGCGIPARKVKKVVVKLKMN